MKAADIVHDEIEKFFGLKIEDTKTFLYDIAKKPHDVINLSFHLENKFKFRFVGDTWNEVKTVGQACRLIRSITGGSDKSKVKALTVKLKNASSGEKSMKRNDGIIRYDTRVCARALLKQAFLKALERKE